MYTNTANVTNHEGVKVTVYIPGMMGNIIRTEARLHETGLRNRTTYGPQAPFAIFTPKRKRKRRGYTAEVRNPFLLIVEGWDAPAPSDMLGEARTDPTTGMTVRESVYSSFDPRWRSDFDATIDDAIASGGVKVILDAREKDHAAS